MLQIMAMASVIRGKFFSVYPNLKETAISAFCHGLVNPRTAPSHESVYHIMWTRTSLTNLATFQPNHFVPLCFNFINCVHGILFFERRRISFVRTKQSPLKKVRSPPGVRSSYFKFTHLSNACHYFIQVLILFYLTTIMIHVILYCFSFIFLLFFVYLS